MIRRVLTCSLALLLFSCQSQESPDGNDPEETAQKTPKPIYIGTIYQVYPTHNFALVRLARDTPRVGVTLISHPGDGTNLRLGNLVVSAEKVDNTVSRMIAADIRSGTVMRGDAVYIYMNLAANPAKTQDTTSDSNEPFEPLIAMGTERPQGFQIPAGDTTPDWMDEDSGTSSATIPSFAPSTVSEPVNTGVAPPKLNKTNTTPDPEVPDFIKKIPDSVDGWENL